MVVEVATVMETVEMEDMEAKDNTVEEMVVE